MFHESTDKTTSCIEEETPPPAHPGLCNAHPSVLRKDHPSLGGTHRMNFSTLRFLGSPKTTSSSYSAFQFSLKQQCKKRIGLVGTSSFRSNVRAFRHLHNHHSVMTNFVTQSRWPCRGQNSTSPWATVGGGVPLNEQWRWGIQSVPHEPRRWALAQHMYEGLLRLSTTLARWVLW